MPDNRPVAEEKNRFEGAVFRNGILFQPGGASGPNTSHGNRFDLGDSLAALGAQTTLTLSRDIHGNIFTGDLGTVIDDAPTGANDYRGETER